LETLLEGKDRMARNYPVELKRRLPASDGRLTNLTKMLLNVAPGSRIDDDENFTLVVAGKNADDEAKKEDDNNDAADNISEDHYIPPHYQENYEQAYRKCQDRPGGAFLFCPVCFLCCNFCVLDDVLMYPNNTAADSLDARPLLIRQSTS